jgi:hypothetical protein
MDAIKSPEWWLDSPPKLNLYAIWTAIRHTYLRAGAVVVFIVVSDGGIDQYIFIKL